MNRSIFWRLVWKEYRLQRALWIAMAVLTLIAQLAVVAMVNESDRTRFIAIFHVGLAAAALYALACGATLFATEHEAGTYDFQRALPVSAGRLFLGKVAFAVASTLAILAALWFLSWIVADLGFSHPGFPDWDDQAEVWGLWGVAAAELLAWGIFFSLLSTRPLVAVILAVAAASFCVDRLASGYSGVWQPGVYVAVVPRRLLVAGLVALADLGLGFRFFREAGRRPAWTRRLRIWGRRLARIASAPALAEGYSRRVMFGRLFWQHWRQSRRMILVLIALAFPMLLWMAGTGGFGHGGGRFPGWAPEDNPTRFLAFGLAAVLAVPLGGASVFLGDQTRRGFRFLAEHGAGPGLVWWSRQLVWAVTLGLGAAIGLGVLSWAQKGIRVEVFAELVVVAYTAGQLCSMLIRNGIVAAAISMVLIVPIYFWTVLMWYLEMSWLWSVAPLCLAFLVATRLRTRDWLLERTGLRAWVRAGWPVAVAVVGIPAAVMAVRVYQVPGVELGFSPEEFARPASREALETMAIYSRAYAKYVPESQFKPSEPNAPSEALRLGTKELHVPAWEPQWLKANQEAIAFTLEASRRQGADLLDPSVVLNVWRVDQLAYLLVANGRRLQAEGKLDEAWNRYRAALRVSVHMRMRSSHIMWADQIEQNVYSPLRLWAGQSGQTSARVAGALADLDAILARVPSRCDTIEAAYVESLRRLDPSFEGIGAARVHGGPTFLEEAIRSMPWEKARAMRLLDYVTALCLRDCRSAENLAKSGGRVRFTVGPSRPPEEIRRLTRTTLALYESQWETPIWGVENSASLETERRATRLILAIEAYKLQHGRLPKTLQELVGPYLKEMLHDPYTGEPFRYFPEGVPGLLIEPLRYYPGGVPGLLNEPSAAEAGPRALEVEARKPFLWSAGTGVWLARPNDGDFRRYDIRSSQDWRVWRRPGRDLDVWQAGWVFPVP